MTDHRVETVWMETSVDYSVDDLAAMSGLPAALLDALVACSALPSRDDVSAHPRFSGDAVVLVRAAARLREHFELDEHGLAVAVTLLRRVRVLEARVVELRARASAPPDPEA